MVFFKTGTVDGNSIECTYSYSVFFSAFPQVSIICDVFQFLEHFLCELILKYVIIYGSQV